MLKKSNAAATVKAFFVALPKNVLRFLKFSARNHRHVFSGCVTVALICLSIFVFPTAFNRIIESCRDLGLSVAFWFVRIFDIESSIVPTVTTLPKVFPAPFLNIADNFETFAVDWKEYWKLWATMENFTAYWSFVADALYYTSKILLIVMPFFILFYVLIRRYFEKENNDYNVDSKPLRIWKKGIDKAFTPLRSLVESYVEFLKENGFWWKIWAVIMAYNFNLITIVLEFFAFYYFFVSTFEFKTVYNQFYKLVIDITPMATFIPIPFWVVIGICVFHYVRRKIGYDVLEHHERKNRGFLNSLPKAFLIGGTMGIGKTKTLVNLTLSQEVEYRDHALESMIKIDLKFPNFPWINLEKEVQRYVKKHKAYNLETVRRELYKKRERFKRSKRESNIFGYEFKRNTMTFDDGLTVTDIWDGILNYAQHYYVYCCVGTMILGNLSIRVDSIKMDIGNLPLWDNDFFRRKAKDVKNISRYSHLLDFDALRLGKRVLANNKYAGTFEFGVIDWTEAGKDVGNAIENQEFKKNDTQANPKNDLLIDRLKYIRMAATVEGYCYACVIMDEQRMSTLGADLRQLCDLIYLRSSSEFKLAMPFFSLEELIHDSVMNKFTNLYTQYRHVRGDNTLLIYFLKWIVAKYDHYVTRIHNTFGYEVLKCEREVGMKEGVFDECKIYMSYKKIYSGRYSTDCYRDLFAERLGTCEVGINDYPTYKTVKADFDELESLHSYNVAKILKYRTKKK